MEEDEKETDVICKCPFCVLSFKGFLTILFYLVVQRFLSTRFHFAKSHVMPTFYGNADPVPNSETVDCGVPFDQTLPLITKSIYDPKIDDKEDPTKFSKSETFWGAIKQIVTVQEQLGSREIKLHYVVNGNSNEKVHPLYPRMEVAYYEHHMAHNRWCKPNMGLSHYQDSVREWDWDLAGIPVIDISCKVNALKLKKNQLLIE